MSPEPVATLPGSNNQGQAVDVMGQVFESRRPKKKINKAFKSFNKRASKLGASISRTIVEEEPRLSDSGSDIEVDQISDYFYDQNGSPKYDSSFKVIHDSLVPEQDPAEHSSDDDHPRAEEVQMRRQFDDLHQQWSAASNSSPSPRSKGSAAHKRNMHHDNGTPQVIPQAYASQRSQVPQGRQLHSVKYNPYFNGTGVYQTDYEGAYFKQANLHHRQQSKEEYFSFDDDVKLRLQREREQELEEQRQRRQWQNYIDTQADQSQDYPDLIRPLSTISTIRPESSISNKPPNNLNSSQQQSIKQPSKLSAKALFGGFFTKADSTGQILPNPVNPTNAEIPENPQFHDLPMSRKSNSVPSILTPHQGAWTVPHHAPSSYSSSSSIFSRSLPPRNMGAFTVGPRGYRTSPSGGSRSSTSSGSGGSLGTNYVSAASGPVYSSRDNSPRGSVVGTSTAGPVAVNHGANMYEYWLNSKRYVGNVVSSPYNYLSGLAAGATGYFGSSPGTSVQPVKESGLAARSSPRVRYEDDEYDARSVMDMPVSPRAESAKAVRIASPVPQGNLVVAGKPPNKFKKAMRYMLQPRPVLASGAVGAAGVIGATEAIADRSPRRVSDDSRSITSRHSISNRSEIGAVPASSLGTQAEIIPTTAREPTSLLGEMIQTTFGASVGGALGGIAGPAVGTLSALANYAGSLHPAIGAAVFGVRSLSRLSLLLQPLDALALSFPILRNAVIATELLIIMFVLYAVSVAIAAVAHVIRVFCLPVIIIIRILTFRIR